MMRQGSSRSSSVAVSVLLRLCAISFALSSVIVMDTSGECIPSSGAATFRNTRFGAFVFFVGCSITAAILEPAAVYLQLRLSIVAANKTVAEKEEERKQGIRAAGILLVVVDLLVATVLFSGMVAAYVSGDMYRDQIGACAQFSRQVEKAKILSAAACVAVTLAGNTRDVQL